MSCVKYRTTLDPNGYRQWARPSLRVFILKELNAAAECKGLASETNQDQRSTSVNCEKHGMRHTVSLLSFLHQGLKDNSKCHNKQSTSASQQNFQVRFVIPEILITSEYYVSIVNLYHGCNILANQIAI